MLHQLFEKQVLRTPYQVVLVFENKDITYFELNVWANKLAFSIREKYQATYQKELCADTAIGLYFERGPEMIVSILAVLKAGAAYIPISTDYPAERTDFIIEDADIAILIGQAKFERKLNTLLNSGKKSIPFIAADDRVAVAHLPESDLNNNSALSDLAYIIYTSGTTGNPKGVMIENGTFSKFITNLNDQFFEGPISTLSITNYTFDVFGVDYALPIITGGKIILSDIYNARQRLKEHASEINLIQQTPSAWSLFFDQNEQFKELDHISIFIGGESGAKSLFDKLVSTFGTVYHGYGPTEDCVWSTFSKYDGVNERCIGFPIDGEQAYVLSENGKQVEEGEIGELHLAGAGIARGYLNRPELTAEKFIPNQFSKELSSNNKTLYKTGDLVRFLPGKGLEFIGRIDSQVKFHGYRIELGEIETKLQELSKINQAVVILLNEDDRKYLVAYIVSTENQSVDIEKVKSELAQKLPEYMVPSVVMQLEKMPMSTNGKLDRDALPKVVFKSSESYTAPTTDLEKKLCGIWESILKIEQVGINDNFFKLGGDSITAVQISWQCRAEIGVDIPLNVLYKHKTISGITNNILDQELVTIPNANVEQPNLSFAQERLLFIERFEEGTSAYHMVYFAKLKANVNWSALRKAFDLLIDRHPVLRTVFLVNESGKNYQKTIDTRVEVQNHEAQNQQELEHLVDKQIEKPFDLTVEPSIRLHQFDTKEEQYLLILWHHIASDGWSTDIFISELAILYQGLVNDEAIELPQLDITYVDYSIWQRDYIQGENLDQLLNYWKQKLTGFETLNLLTDFARPKQIDYRGRDYTFELDSVISSNLRELARSQETTLYTILLSAYYILLQKLSGQLDLIIGTPSDNRPHAQTQNIIGFFVNTLPLRVQLSSEITVQELINQVHETITEAKINQELPLEKMVDKLKVERDASRHPIFQVLFGLQDFGASEDNKNDLPFVETDLKEGESLYAPARFDLGLLLTNNESKIEGIFNYSVSLFKEESVKRILELYRQILNEIVSDQEQAVLQINAISANEKEVLLTDWSGVEEVYPFDKTLHGLFEEQAALSPDNIALTSETETLTYGELNAKANQLARVIRDTYQSNNNEAMPADTFVGLYLERGVEMVISILAVLKAGGTYVPISPEYPIDRVKFILNDTKAPIMLLPQDEMANIIMDGWLSELNQMPALVIADDANSLSGQATENLENTNEASDLAYVIYTSGTTGQPKGVLTPHQAVVSLVQDNHFISLSEKDVFLHLSNPNFDAATLEIWGALTHGAKLVTPKENVSLSAEKLEETLKAHEVSVLWLTKTLFDSLYTQTPTLFGGLKYLLVGGEALTPDLIKGLVNQTERPTHILNGYGPTESTTFTTTHDCADFGNTVPLGKPINTRKVYVLDASGNIAPIGSPGELHIAGAGLARGYLNRPELTAEKFINNSFATADDKAKGYDKLYKTGDLVRWLADGTLEYLSRMDSQIKLRGYRIELGEIETALNELVSVKQAVVVDLEKEGSKYLAAYVVPVEGEDFSADELRAKLVTRLPDYMVPNSFTELDTIPLTINGKLDRKALPYPEFKNAEEYTAPRNEIEEKLCTIWQEILGREKVGVHDNFFHIGGDSIVAIRVISKGKERNLQFSVLDIFTNPTVEALSTKVKTGVEAEEEYVSLSLLSQDLVDHLNELYSGNVVDAYPATHLQMGMLLESTRDIGVYHDVLSYEIKGSFDLGIIETLLQKLVNKHEVLRTSFIENDKHGYLGLVRKEFTPLITVFNEPTDYDELVIQELKKAFDFEQPLYRFLISEIEDNRFLLTLSFHHAIIDGWSVASLVKEFTDSYLKGIEINASQDGVPKYGEFVKRERKAINDQKHLDFWSEYLSAYDASDYSFVQSSVSNEVTQYHEKAQVSESDSEIILDIAKEYGISVDTIFLAVYHQVLCLFEDTKDYTIGLVTNNRLEMEGGDKLLGLFLNTIPFRPAISEENTFAGLIKHITQEKARVIEHKALPYGYIKSNFDSNGYQCAFNYIHFHINENADSEQNNDPVLEYEKINIPMLFTVARENERFELSAAAHKGSIGNFMFQQFWEYYQLTIKELCLSRKNLINTVLPTLTKKDNALLKDWNDVEPASPIDQTLHGLFEKQVAKTPENVALVFNDVKLTYRELNSRVNQMASHLRVNYVRQNNSSLEANSLIGLYFDRGLEMVIGILAVLKAGAAYVPISPYHPFERTDYILNDAKISIVLTESKYLEELQEGIQNGTSNPAILIVDNTELAESDSVENPELDSFPQDLAYVIYTSGTTGKPKGVEISHKASLTRNWHMTEIGHTVNNTYLFKTNYIFDVSVSDLFSHLFVGAKIIITASLFDVEEIIALQEKHVVNACHFVPSQFPTIVNSSKLHLNLDQLYFSGENLTKEHLDEIDLAKTNVVNYYGPTETGETTSFNVKSADEEGVIGKPFNGTKAYVLTKKGGVSPVGCSGELHVSGVGLANGYLNLPTLTKEKFIDNPFADDQDKKLGYNRLYKTGDLVRWKQDGNLEYLGRIDNQIKLRGYRIELGEIESALTEFKEVRQAVVIDLPKGKEKYLAAYIVCEENQTLDLEVLRERLETKLPDYMVPSSFNILDAIPLTNNGKLNREALPNSEYINQEEYTAPTTDLQEKLCAIWEELLEIDKVGINDSFFRLGGNSMNAIRLASMSRKKLKLDISMPLLFQHKTIANLSKNTVQVEEVFIPTGLGNIKKTSSQKNKMKL
jgi:tyrocidine synthetase-3